MVQYDRLVVNVAHILACHTGFSDITKMMKPLLLTKCVIGLVDTSADCSDH